MEGGVLKWLCQIQQNPTALLIQMRMHSSRFGAAWAFALSFLMMWVTAAAQDEVVTVQGRKASAKGLLVRVKNGMNAAQMLTAKGRLNQVAMKTKAEFRTQGLMLVEKDVQPRASAAMTSAELEQKAKALMATGLYEYVEPDWIVTVSQTPTDAAFTDGSLWGLRNTGLSGGVAGVDVNALPAWAVTRGSQTVVVGVVDTGIRYTHQDLAGNMWVNPGEIPGNGIDDDANGYIDDVHGINGITNTGNPMDDNDHGTHCAGTIGATANDAGQIVGVAWNVKLMALKFLSASGSGSTSDAIKCIDYGVAHGAHILSNSWGGGGYSQALRDSIEAASAAGVLFVAAAGNSSSNNDLTQNFPSNYDPANVVAVAAVDRTGALASFSSYGAQTVDLGAPGVAILSSTASSDTSYASFNGTSMATPHVAGVAALIKSHFPSATMVEVKNRLLATTRPLASLAGRTLTGGMVDAHAALTVMADGVLELRASAASSPLRNGQSTAFYVTVTDLTPITGATVTAALDGGAPVAFLDNGAAPDAIANDGIYSANLTVPATGSSTTLHVTASHGGVPATDAFVFSVLSPPANDDFANRILLAAGSTQAFGANRLATFESAEPRFPSVSGTKSVWWEWASGVNGSITVTTSGSSYDTTLAVYSGTGTLASLVHLGSNDDFIGLTSSVTFTATSGSRYYFQVNGYGGSEGNITLNYPSPANINSPPVIVTQPVGTILVAGDELALSVTASGTAPLNYQWALDGTAIPGATAAAYTVASVTAANQGNYTVTITNAFGSLTSAAAFVGVDPISVRPPNDTFANAEPLAGATGRISGSNLRASGEPGEPNHAGASVPIESVWYRWTAPADGTLSLDTYGSSLDTTLAVYTGTAVDALTLLAENNDSGGVQSFVSLAVTAGQVLSIAVDGVGTAESLFSLNYLFQPSVAGLENDAFANRKVVSGAGGTFMGSNITATGEVGEPVHEASAPPTASVWWAWTAPKTGVAVMDTLGSDFDTVLAVYTGAEVSSLTLITSNDDAGGPQSRVAFPCVAGTAYAIAVDGNGAAEGLITLSITSGTTEPEIQVEQPVGVELVDGGAGVSWGDVALGGNAERTFTVRNLGGAQLTNLSVRIEGASAADFVLTTPPSAPLNTGASTSFTVRFTPAGFGAYSAVLRLLSNDADESPFDISLSGVGVPPMPEIVVEEPAGVGLVDGAATTAFGSVAVGSSSSRTYTVRNIGNTSLTGLAVTLTGTHAADFFLLSAPAVTVAPGNSTSFVVNFSPSGFGQRTAALMLASNDADENPFDVALTGNGTVSPPVVRVVNATDRGWYLSNGTHTTSNLNYRTGFDTEYGLEARSFFVFAVPTLGVNESVVAAELRLWNPSNGFFSEDASETFEVHHVATSPTAFIDGTAGVAGFTDLLDGPLLAGPKAVSASDNASTVVIPLNSAALAEIESKAGGQVAFGGSLTTLAANQLQHIFGYTTGNFMTHTQLVLSTATNYSNAKIVVEQPAGTMLVSGVSGVSFGQISTIDSANRVFTLRNVGIYDLTGLNVTVSGTNAADFIIASQPAGSLAPGRIAEFTVRLSPLTPGAKNAVLSIASNDPDENPFEIHLTATVVPPAPEIVVEQPAGNNLVDGTSLVNFGYRAMGASNSLVFTVRNTGQLDLNALSITIDGTHAADYSVTSAPATSVAPGGSTNFTVRFSPVASGLRTAVLHLASNDADENPFDIFLNGNGFNMPAGLEFKIVSLEAAGSAVVDHNELTGDDRGGIAVTMESVFVTGDFATSRHALDLTGGVSIGRVSDGLCSDIGTGTAYVLAHQGVEISYSHNTVSQLIELDPFTGARTSTIIQLTTPLTTGNNCGVFSGNGRIVVHTGTRMYDILVPSGVVTDLGPMITPAWYFSESWAVWGVAEFFDGAVHLAYRSSNGARMERFRVPDGQVQTIATFTNLSDLASWTVSPSRGRWYFHHEYGSQFGGSSETLGYADATFEIGLPTQPPVITSPLTATATTNAPFSYNIRASLSPTSYQATGLPAGLSVNTSTGLISGTVSAAGVYTFNISATNVVGTTTRTLSLTVSPALTSFFDDFDPDIDQPLWSAFGGTVTANTAGQAAGTGSTSKSLHFDGDGSRFATTVPLDTRGSQTVNFLIALADGTSNPWERADIGEEVVLEYSSNGGNFVEFGGPYSNRTWQSITAVLPAAAKTSATRFRWRQFSNSGSGFDHWAIEDVRINSSLDLAPEIVVEQPEGLNLIDGEATVDFGRVPMTGAVSRTFTIRNTGSAPLTGIAVTFSGGNAANWSLTTAPASALSANGSTTFTVSYSPVSLGARSAMLRIASNDANENPFDVTLTGTGVEFAGTVSLFTNGSYVDATEEGEMQRTRTALLNAGYVVTPFTGITQADWGTAFAANAVVIPELELSSLTLSAPAISTILHYLDSGKGLVIMGDAGNHDTSFLNQLKGWSLAGGATLAGSTLTKVADVPGFLQSPATLVAPLSTHTVTTASLPVGAQPVYQQGTNTAVFWNDRIGFMAYDWFVEVNSAWTTVLKDLISEVTRGLDRPEITVERPLGTALTDGVSLANLDYAAMGDASTNTFTIRNVGGQPLTGISVSVSGAHAADFLVTVQPTMTLAPAGSTTFTLSFAPTAVGERSAALHINSNDEDENPFDISLRGWAVPSGVTPIGSHEPFPANSANSANHLMGQRIHVPNATTLYSFGVDVRHTGTQASLGLYTDQGGAPAALVAQTGAFTFPRLGRVERPPTQAVQLSPGNYWIMAVYNGTASVGRSTSAATSVAYRTLSFTGTLPATFGPATFYTAQSFNYYILVAEGEIGVEQPVGVDLTDGAATTAFGLVAVPVTRQFTVRNSGNGTLSGMGLTMLGTHAADFSIVTPLVPSLAAGASTTFAIRFTPTHLGARQASLQISSNDADENPFDISLNATAITPAQGLTAWLPPALTDRTPTGTPYQDGLPNLLKYAFNLDADSRYHRAMESGGTTGLPLIRCYQAQGLSILRFEYLRRIGSGLIYTPLKSASLEAGDWNALSSTPVITPINEGWERVVHEEPLNPHLVPACFGRVQVHLP